MCVECGVWSVDQCFTKLSLTHSRLGDMRLATPVPSLVAYPSTDNVSMSIFYFHNEEQRFDPLFVFVDMLTSSVIQNETGRQVCGVKPL